jgi:hypothetical protein
MFVNFLKNHPYVSGLCIVTIVIILGSLVYVSSNNSSNSSGSATDTTTTDGYDGSGYTGAADESTLPYENYLYTISAPKDNTITITAYDGFRNAAISQLYSMGVDPTNYKIVFNYESPFTPYE